MNSTKIFAWSASVFLAMPLFSALALSSAGSPEILNFWTTLASYSIPAIMLSAGVAFVSIIVLFMPSHRHWGKQLFVLSLLTMVAIPAGLYCSLIIREQAFVACVARSEPLVRAIKAYAAKHTVPLEKLENLVPEFIDKVPDTGMGAYPKYYWYQQTAPNTDLQLSIPTPIGGHNSDMLFYRPDGKYASTVDGRIGDWAYTQYLNQVIKYMLDPRKENLPRE